ncbi:MAG TPA: hypothetical protein VGM90_37615 [Kofleriaceae bacterium]|jgi:hypothetical protein
MRSLILVAALPAIAFADTGVYLQEGFGGVAHRGQLSRYSDGDARMTFGLGVRRDDDVLLVYGSITGGGLFAYDCYGEECRTTATADYGTFGVDFRKRVPLLYMHRLFSKGTYVNPVLTLELGGGPRWSWGDFGSGHSSTTSGSGPGLGVNATLAANFWVIGYYLEVGADVMHFDLEDGSTVRGSAPYMMFGGRIGWL